MPSRKKRSRNPTRATRWSAEEEEHLLAWLDHCIRYDIDFDTTVASRMRIVTQRAPTQRQCTWKVIWFRKTYCPNTSPQIIWLKGSSILELEEESRQRIRQLCHELEPPEQSRESSVLSSLGSTPSYPGSEFCVEGDEQDAVSTYPLIYEDFESKHTYRIVPLLMKSLLQPNSRRVAS